MEGTGEIKYPGQTETSTVALRLTEWYVKPRGRKPRKKNHLVLQVKGCAKDQLPVHGKHWQAKNSQRSNGIRLFFGQNFQLKKVQRLEQEELTFYCRYFHDDIQSNMSEYIFTIQGD